MTVCIGAICEDGHAIVVAADRMMTYGAPLNLQVEMTVRKIVPVTGTTAVLFSGSVPDGEGVISRTRAKIAATAQTVHEIATATVAAYQELKRQRVEDTILRPLLGIDFVAFTQLVAQSASSQILQQVLGMISQQNMQLDLLVVGFDDGVGHIFGITNPGVLVPGDTVGSLAIGSGAMHASVRLSLGKQVRDLKFPQTVYNVYEAKVAAEVAPGVGKMTDMAVLRPSGIDFFKDAAFDVLSSIRQDRPPLGGNESKQLADLCKDYSHEPAKP